MKRYLPVSILAVSCFASMSTTAEAVVTSSDLAILGLYMDGNANGANTGDAFLWVALNDIAAGETLYFSDSSYTGAGYVAEGLISLTVQAGGIAAGTVSFVEAGNLGAGYSNVPNTAFSDADIPSLTFSSSGDSLFIFQGDGGGSDISNPANITPLWALNNSSTGWGYTSSGTETALYPTLTDGVNALSVGAGAGFSDEFDNTRFVLPGSYGGTFNGTADEFRALVQDENNWEGSNSTAANVQTWLEGGFNSIDVVPEPSSSSLLAIAGLSLIMRRKK